MSEWVGKSLTLCWWFSHRRPWPRGNQSSKVPTSGIVRHEGSGGPSLLPQDRSDPHPQWHTVVSETLCIEYAIQVPDDGLSTGLNIPKPELVAMSRLWTDLQQEIVPKNCRNPHIPDNHLTWSIGVISKYMEKPTVEHLQCAHRQLWYVNGTKDRRLLYQHGITKKLVSYTDVGSADDVLDRRSTSGFMFSLGSVVVAWATKSS